MGRLPPELSHQTAPLTVTAEATAVPVLLEPEFALGLLSIILAFYPASLSGVRVRGWCNR